MNATNEKQLQLLSAALRTVGGNFDVPTLDLILSVLEEIKIKGETISIGDVNELSKTIFEKYKVNEQKPGQ